MFSTSFQDSLRYIVVCITNSRVISLVDTIVDTGAIYTCYMAHSIDIELTEADLQENGNWSVAPSKNKHRRVLKESLQCL